LGRPLRPLPYVPLSVKQGKGEGEEGEKRGEKGGEGVTLWWSARSSRPVREGRYLSKKKKKEGRTEEKGKKAKKGEMKKMKPLNLFSRMLALDKVSNSPSLLSVP